MWQPLVKSFRMPRLEREYQQRFSAETLRLGYGLFKELVAGQVPEERRAQILAEGQWQHYPEASEFFAAYTPDAEAAEIALTYKTSSFLFVVDGATTRVEVGLPDDGNADRVIQVFEAATKPSVPRWLVFVGHGRDRIWLELSDHLSSLPDVEVRTYENSIAAGVTAIELLEQLAMRVDFAVLIHTCDDKSPNPDGRPSANVIHETGFFQGALGRHRTLVVRERGCPSFHNIGGLHEVTFEPEAISTTFEHVVRLIRDVEQLPE